MGQTGGPSGIDINVIPVWKDNITGNGVVVSIIDDGLEYTNPDLEKNYVNFNFNRIQMLVMIFRGIFMIRCQIIRSGLMLMEPDVLEK